MSRSAESAGKIGRKELTRQTDNEDNSYISSDFLSWPMGTKCG